MFSDHDEYQAARLVIAALFGAALASSAGLSQSSAQTAAKAAKLADALLAECGYADPDTIRS